MDTFDKYIYNFKYTMKNKENKDCQDFIYAIVTQWKLVAIL